MIRFRLILGHILDWYGFILCESTFIVGDDAYDYFRGHSITLKYEFDARKRHYLYKMMPSKGYKINASLS